MKSFNATWLDTVRKVMTQGHRSAPRGMETRELQHHSIAVDMRRPVLTIPERKLSYQFMAAEAFWILSGDDSVRGVAPWNDNIRRYSDDGERFFGAYGVKIREQFDYVINKLLEDPDSRQAGLTIWRENPPKTKDVPCTIALWCQLRRDELDVHAFMRSSDVWMGLPYDVFTFSMFGHFVCGHLNSRMEAARTAGETPVRPGTLHLTAASSHLYLNTNQYSKLLELDSLPKGAAMTPTNMYRDPRYMLDVLEDLRDTKKGDPLRWWERG